MSHFLPAVQRYRNVVAVGTSRPGDAVALNPQPLPPKQGVVGILIGL